MSTKTEEKTIALAKIVEAPWNTRAEITEDSVSTLAASIREDGLLQPLNVIADKQSGTEAYICFDGCRRLNALRSINAKNAPCRVWDITDEEAQVKTITANIMRADDDPLLAAKVIGELLVKGVKPEQIATKIGKTTPWVRRRAKLCALDAEVAQKIVGKATLEAIERIAEMPSKAQGSLVKEVERYFGYKDGSLVTAADIRFEIKREQSNLDSATFDTSKCKKCMKRTGAQPDLWGETGGELGHCNDRDCFKARIEAHEDALVEAATQGAKEVERVDSRWDVPDEADADKPTKKNPCAYVYIERGTAVVKYGPARATIEAAKAKAYAERESERAEQNAEYERNNEIRRHFTETMQAEERDDDLRGFICGAIKKSGKARAYAVDIIADYLSDLWNEDRIISALEAFDGLREFCGISEEDAAWFIGRNTHSEEECE